MRPHNSVATLEISGLPVTLILQIVCIEKRFDINSNGRIIEFHDWRELWRLFHLPLHFTDKEMDAQSVKGAVQGHIEQASFHNSIWA